MDHNFTPEELQSLLSKMITPFLQQLDQEVLYLVNYIPGEPAEVILVTAAEEETEEENTKPHGTTCPTKYIETPAEVVFEHVLDYSFYNYGCTIDKQFHQPIFNALGGRLERGQHKDIVLRYEDKEFKAQLENVDRHGVKSDTIRCMWKGKAAAKLSTYLRQQFADDFKTISDLHEAHINRLPDNLKRFALFYNPEDGVFEMKVN